MDPSVEVRFVVDMAALVPELGELLDEQRAKYDEVLAYPAVADFARLVASSAHEEPSTQWPHTQLFATFDEWRERVMLPDHSELSA